ncbi:hypothetical protein T484DRAFT_1842623 [Baffinella frigidus]|nr:hypothetical protein T484DRAFT_1842623 [Cryptophyta sp. CCMP2293]
MPVTSSPLFKDVPPFLTGRSGPSQVSTEGLRAELSSVEEEAEDREPAASPLVFLEPELAIPLLFLEEGTDRDAEHEREKWRGPWKVQDEMALSHDTPHGPTTPEEAGLGLQTQQGQGAEEAAPLSREQPGHLQGEGHVQGQGGALDRGGLGVCHREEGGLPQGGGKGAGERVVLGALNLSRQGGVGGEVCRGGSGDGQQGGAPGGVERSGCLLERVVLGDLNLSLQAPLARFGDALCPKAVAAERWRRQALDSRTRRIFEL